MTVERRTIPTEVRADDEGGKLAGYAAVFYRADDPGTEFQLWPGLKERIMPGAFERAIAEDDVRGLFNHDANIVLGRNTAGTLALSEDGQGLRYVITPPSSRADVVESVERGDVTGSSFAFRVKAERYVEDPREEGAEIREIEEVELFDVGPVTFPAYEGSTAEKASRGYAQTVAPEVRARGAAHPVELDEATPEPGTTSNGQEGTTSNQPPEPSVDEAERDAARADRERRLRVIDVETA